MSGVNSFVELLLATPNVLQNQENIYLTGLLLLALLDMTNYGYTNLVLPFY